MELAAMKTIYSHVCAECFNYSFEFHEGAHKCETKYAWACDHCGVQMEIIFHDEGREIEQRKTGKRCERTKLLLKLKELPMAIIADGVTWGGDSAYFYEEHTCPSNVMRECEEIVFCGAGDPHGMFELIEEVMITGPDGREEDEVTEELMEKAKRITNVDAISERED